MKVEVLRSWVGGVYSMVYSGSFEQWVWGKWKWKPGGIVISLAPRNVEGQSIEFRAVSTSDMSIKVDDVVEKQGAAKKGKLPDDQLPH